MPSQFTHINREAFESWLDSFAEWKEIELEGTNERVYQIGELPSDKHDVLIFSTIEGSSTRACGNDAIRCVLWNWDIGAPVSGRRKTLRIAPTDSNPDGWRGNLKPKIESLMLSWRDYDKECPVCGADMRYRDRYDFFGCSRYPECEGSRPA